MATILFRHCNLLLISGLGEQCNETAGCFLPEDGTNQRTECVERQCRCIAGYEPTPDSRSCRSKYGANGAQSKVEPTDYLYLISPVEIF